jgi:transcriptional regulator GlxA family with amidase domain
MRDAGIDGDLASALSLERPVAELAARLPVSRRTLERRARARFGRGLAAERRARRIAQAQRLLAATELPIGEVARRAGFASHPQLVRVFRREIGMTPLAWRQGAGGG